MSITNAPTFSDILQERLNRRDFLKRMTAASALVISGSVLDTGCAFITGGGKKLGFTPIQPVPAHVDSISIAEGYRFKPLLRWGDPIFPDAPEFNIEKLSAAAQEKQFGYNCDYVAFMPLPFGSGSSTRGLLAVNNEYCSPVRMFRHFKKAKQTREQVDIQLAAHGVSIVEIYKDEQGEWHYEQNSSYNRRITGNTPIGVSGPAADHIWLKTSGDPDGSTVLGTLNNCSGGKTPWGTVVTSEENFQKYFGNLQSLSEADPRLAIHRRYNIKEKTSVYAYEKHQARFDVWNEPNEPFRFGWPVEFDPYDPERQPVKRTALGRFRHEAQNSHVAKNGRVVVYSGDDDRFEYVYKFVTKNAYDAENREVNWGLLDEGNLYVARFNADGSGEWLPLVFGHGPLTEENGFTSQGDVLVKTRLAADALGATPMDRPEDIETNPVNGKVYIALTNNSSRGDDDKEAVDAANPRPENRWGHIIELTEANDDHTAETFNWEMFLLCGDPADESTYFAGFPKEQVSPIANPDNIAFDKFGNLWIATDGQSYSLNYNDGFFAVPTKGKERGFVRQFFSAVTGSEICGPEFTPDNKTLFLAIQHPGSGGTFDEPISLWPDGKDVARPSVVVIQSEMDDLIGLA